MILVLRIAFHAEVFVGFIFKYFLQCLIASQITYLCIAKDIVYNINQPSQQHHAVHMQHLIAQMEAMK